MSMLFAPITALGAWLMLRMKFPEHAAARIIAAVALTALCAALYRRQLKKTKLPLCLFSALASLSVSTGFLLDLPLTLADGALKFAAYALGFALCLYPLILSMTRLTLAGLGRLGNSAHTSRFDRLSPVLRFVIILLAILIAWLPVYLAYYPGLWNYDPWQVDQVLRGKYSSNHPLLHTLLLGNCYKLGYLLTGEGNLGVMLYDAVQALILASALSYCYLFICRRCKSRLLRFISLAFFMLFPVNPIMAISSTKDVIFSALVLMTLLLTIEYIDLLKNRAGISLKRLVLHEIALALISILMLLFRNNAVCGFAGMVILLAAYAVRHRCLRRIIALGMICLAGFGLFNVGLSRGLNARSGAIKELLSIPAAQFGRVWFTGAHESPARDEMARYYVTDSMKYQPALSDSMKKYIVEPEGSGKLGYIFAWLELMKEYPDVCADAFLYLNKGAWHISDRSHAEVYGTSARQGYMQTGVEGGYFITHESKLPELEKFLESFLTKNAHQDIPVLNLLFAPALYYWIAMLGAAVMLSRKNGACASVCAFLLCHHLTIMLGPCTLVRYMYPFMLCAPMILCLIAENLRENADGAAV